MLYTIEELEREVSGNVFDVYEVFKNFFGEEYVDLQSGVNLIEHIPSPEEDGEHYDISQELLDILLCLYQSAYWDIIVYWPRVTITNENNRSIDIHDLYAKVTIQKDGTIPFEYTGFTLNRSRYTKEQFNHKSGSGFLHSHVCSIPKSDLSNFQVPCLGRGPINETIHTLKSNNDEVTWMLFCQELAMYVTVESLNGVPYNYLESVGSTKKARYYHGYEAPLSVNSMNGLDNWYSLLTKDDLRNFIAYYLNNGHLNLSYKEGEYTIGMPYFDYIIDVSNSFIEFYNHGALSDNSITPNRLFESCILRRVVVSDHKFYDNDAVETMDYSSYVGRHVLYFKGRDITLTIDDSSTFTPEATTVLDNSIAMQILFSILLVINYRYKNERTNRNTLTTTGKNVRYL